MARTKKGTPPSYRQHASGQAVVTVRTTAGQRKDILLGAWDNPISKEEYRRVLALLDAHQGRYPVNTAPAAAVSDLSVNEVVLAFWRHAEQRYPADSRELEMFRLSLRPLKRLFGHTPAKEFGPRKLKVVQQAMADGSWMSEEEKARSAEKGYATGWCRNVVNRRITRIKTLFKWAESEEMIPGGNYQALRTVAGLPKNSRQVRHTEKKSPTERADLDKVLEQLRDRTPAVAAMLELQWWTGMRSCEVRIMRTCDVDQADPTCWLYRPAEHKNDWREAEQDRVVPLGPECRRILEPWLQPARPETYLFRPARKRRRDHYGDIGYAQAVRRACERAGVKILPYGGRHAAKMRIEREAGVDAARAVLGQKSIQSTQHYGKLDAARAAEVMKKLG
jgi:integrase